MKKIHIVRTLPLFVAVVLSNATPQANPLARTELQDPHRIPEGHKPYLDARSVVDYSREELVKEFPELKHVELSDNQEQLPQILLGVGKTVEAFFRDFPNTISVERVRQEKSGEQTGELDQTFNYLALARPNGIGLEESRTNGKGEEAVDKGLEKSFLLTQRFTTRLVYFHPVHQPGSKYRWLGRNNGGEREYVVAFAQRPGLAQEEAEFFEFFSGRLDVLLLQGIAWIDPESFQIIRMRTDLLAKRDDIGLRRNTTSIEFSEVRFPQLVTSIWLPKEVLVTLEYFREVSLPVSPDEGVKIGGGKIRRVWTFRNRHRYSDYRLFSVETREESFRPRKVR